MLTSCIIYGTFENAYGDGIFYFRDVVYGMSQYMAFLLDVLGLF